MTKILIDMQTEDKLSELQKIILDDMIYGSDKYKKCKEEGKLLLTIKIGKSDMDMLKKYETDLRTLIQNGSDDHILRKFI